MLPKARPSLIQEGWESPCQAIASDIQRRLRLFNGGHLATLWSEATTVAQRPKVVRTRAQVQAQESLSPGAIRTIHSFVEEGALSKAAKHLLSEGLADASDPSVLERLRALHPTAPPVVTGGDTALPDFPYPRLSDADDACDWGKLAWKAVSSFSRDQPLGQAVYALGT